MAQADPPLTLPLVGFLPRAARWLLGAATVLAPFLAPSWIQAQQPVRAGEEFTVNSRPDLAGDPSVAMTRTGEFVVVWSDSLDGSIRGRGFDATGTHRGDEFTVGSAPYLWGPAVAVDDTAQFVVAWGEDHYSSDYQWFLQTFSVQRLDSEGTPLHPEIQVTPLDLIRSDPAVASDSQGNFVVVWPRGEILGQTHLYGRRYDSSGNARAGEFRINVTEISAGYGVEPDVASTGAGEFVVVWKSIDTSGTGSENAIMARRFDSTGAPLGGELRVSQGGLGHLTTAEDPSVAVTGSGRFAVSWIGGDYRWPHISARQFDGDGAPVGGDFQVSAPGHFYYPPGAPDVALDDSGRMMVVWHDVDSFTSVTLWGRGFDSAGNPLGAEFRVDTPTGYRLPAWPSLAMDGAGNFVVVWEQVGPASPYPQGPHGVRAQRFSWEGASANQPPVADAGGDALAECTAAAGALVTLDGSASSDPDSTPGTHDDIVLFQWFEDFGLPTESLLGEGEILDVELALGNHAVTLRVSDSAGETSTDETVAAVIDSTPPFLSVSLSPETLWPPNHRMVEVAATVTAGDLCGTVAVALESVTSSEPDDAPGAGDGATTGDIGGIAAGTPDFDLALRAERRARGPGRLYVILYRATDEAGLTRTVSATVTVPHDRRMRPGPGGEPEGIRRSGTSGRKPEAPDSRPPERPPR